MIAVAVAVNITEHYKVCVENGREWEEFCGAKFNESAADEFSGGPFALPAEIMGELEFIPIETRDLEEFFLGITVNKTDARSFIDENVVKIFHAELKKRLDAVCEHLGVENPFSADQQLLIAYDTKFTGERN